MYKKEERKEEKTGVKTIKSTIREVLPIVFKKDAINAAMENLKLSPKGSYLIRESSAGDGNLTVSFHGEDDDVWNARFVFTSNGWEQDNELKLGLIPDLEKLKLLKADEYKNSIDGLFKQLEKYPNLKKGCLILPTQNQATQNPNLNYIKASTLISNKQELGKLYNDPIETLKNLKTKIDNSIDGIIYQKDISIKEKIYDREELLGGFKISYEKDLCDLEDVVTMELFVDPVVLQTGRVVEKETSLGLKECPFTRQALTIPPVPLNGYRKALDECLATYGELLVWQDAPSKWEMQEKNTTTATTTTTIGFFAEKQEAKVAEKESIETLAQKSWNQLDKDLQEEITREIEDISTENSFLTPQFMWDSMMDLEEKQIMLVAMESRTENCYKK